MLPMKTKETGLEQAYLTGGSRTNYCKRRSEMLSMKTEETGLEQAYLTGGSRTNYCKRRSVMLPMKTKETGLEQAYLTGGSRTTSVMFPKKTKETALEQAYLTGGSLTNCCKRRSEMLPTKTFQMKTSFKPWRHHSLCCEGRIYNCSYYQFIFIAQLW
jgi:hypothetical protein